VNRATSLYLDVVRPIAALVVLLSHVSLANLSGGKLELFASAGVQAVDIFFVLSGFVIAHVYATRERDPGTYLASRAARIYSVAIPALLLTALADKIGQAVDPGSYQGPFQELTPGLIVRSAAVHRRTMERASLPGERRSLLVARIRSLVLCSVRRLLFAPRRWRWAAVLAVLAFIGPKVALMFPAWLMGVWTYRLCTTQRLHPTLGWVLLAAPVAVLAGYEFLSPFSATAVVGPLVHPRAMEKHRPGLSDRRLVLRPYRRLCDRLVRLRAMAGEARAANSLGRGCDILALFGAFADHAPAGGRFAMAQVLTVDARPVAYCDSGGVPVVCRGLRATKRGLAAGDRGHPAGHSIDVWRCRQSMRDLCGQTT